MVQKRKLSMGKINYPFDWVLSPIDNLNSQLLLAILETFDRESLLFIKTLSQSIMASFLSYPID